MYCLPSAVPQGFAVRASWELLIPLMALEWRRRARERRMVVCEL